MPTSKIDYKDYLPKRSISSASINMMLALLFILFTIWLIMTLREYANVKAMNAGFEQKLIKIIDEQEISRKERRENHDRIIILDTKLKELKDAIHP